MQYSKVEKNESYYERREYNEKNKIDNTLEIVMKNVNEKHTLRQKEIVEKLRFLLNYEQ